MGRLGSSHSIGMIVPESVIMDHEQEKGELALRAALRAAVCALRICSECTCSGSG